MRVRIDASARRAPAVGPLERMVHLGVAVACLALLWVARGIEPSEAGHGSHTQLGLPPCAWVIRFDRPCPTCGMTTAVSQASRGDFLSSMITQPAGAAFAIGASGLFWMSLYVAVTGSAVGRLAGALLLRPRGLWCAGTLVGVSWAYKFLMW